LIVALINIRKKQILFLTSMVRYITYEEIEYFGRLIELNAYTKN
jgi:hypothetical protein